MGKLLNTIIFCDVLGKDLLFNLGKSIVLMMMNWKMFVVTQRLNLIIQLSISVNPLYKQELDALDDQYSLMIAANAFWFWFFIILWRSKASAGIILALYDPEKFALLLYVVEMPGRNQSNLPDCT